MEAPHKSVQETHKVTNIYQVTKTFKILTSKTFRQENHLGT